MDAETFYKILLAELNLLDEEPRIGFALMLDSARKTKDALLFERAITIALQARSGESALSAARAWLLAIPTSIDAARYMVQISVSMNRLELPAGKADIAIALEVSKLALAKNASDEEAAQLAIALDGELKSHWLSSWSNNTCQIQRFSPNPKYVSHMPEHWSR